MMPGTLMSFGRKLAIISSTESFRWARGLVMDDDELSQLAGRVQVAQKEMVGGSLTNEQLTYIVIALAAAVLVLVLK